MIEKKDLDNVKRIMDKSRRFATTKEDRNKLDELIKGFKDVSDKYLQEVRTNAALQ
jgi:hypothetical protein